MIIFTENMPQSIVAMDESDCMQHQSTMWLGTEDGCIHVYNCTDNIRTKKNKIKIQQISAVYSILYVSPSIYFLRKTISNIQLCHSFPDTWIIGCLSRWQTESSLCTHVIIVSDRNKFYCQFLDLILNTTVLHRHLEHNVATNDIAWIRYKSHFETVECEWEIVVFHSGHYQNYQYVNVASRKSNTNCVRYQTNHKYGCVQ